MVGVLAIGFVSNLLIRPVADRFHERTGSATAVTTGPVEVNAGHDAPPWATALLPVSWLVVGVPLVYGVYETIAKVARLFG